MEEDLKQNLKNGRRPQQKMEDDLKKRIPGFKVTRLVQYTKQCNTMYNPKELKSQAEH
jgi:hypothetical protein